MIDTPTRLVNESNEFLEIHLVKKRKASVVPKLVKSPKIESTASSQERKKKNKMKDDFLKIVSEAPRVINKQFM